MSSAEERKRNEEESIQRRKSRTLEEQQILKEEMALFLIKIKGGIKTLQRAQPASHREQQKDLSLDEL